MEDQIHWCDSGSCTAATAKRDTRVGRHTQAKASCAGRLELEFVPELDHDVATARLDGEHEMLGKGLAMTGTQSRGTSPSKHGVDGIILSDGSFRRVQRRLEPHLRLFSGGTSFTPANDLLKSTLRLTVSKGSRVVAGENLRVVRCLGGEHPI